MVTVDQTPGSDSVIALTSYVKSVGLLGKGEWDWLDTGGWEIGERMLLVEFLGSSLGDSSYLTSRGG